jgi:hypothetical protein
VSSKCPSAVLPAAADVEGSDESSFFFFFFFFTFSIFFRGPYPVQEQEPH